MTEMKKVLLLLLMLMSAYGAMAYDFAVRINSGDTLFFDITNVMTHHVSVVAPDPKGPDYYSGHQRPSGVLVIPSSVQNIDGQNYKVTSIGDRAFSGCYQLRHVVIPQSVQSIGAYAFYGCSGINERLRIGENITLIGKSAFYGCSSLPEVSFGAVNCSYMGGSVSTTAFGNCIRLRRVIIEKGVRTIPDYAFCGVDALSDSLSLPSSLRTIGAYAFAYCNSLSGNLYIPDSVSVIGECAFHQCHNLRRLVLGQSVAIIGSRAFYHCVGLINVTMRSYRPPTIDQMSFSSLAKGVKFFVPCASKQLYEKSELWKKIGPFTGVGGCSFSVNAEPSIANGCEIIGGGEYHYGDSVCLMAVCRAGFGFERWSDGITANPRCFTSESNLSLTAVIRSVDLIYIHDTVRISDTVYAEGYKLVRDTIDRFDIDYTIDQFPEVAVNNKRHRLEWNFHKGEPLLSLSLYNPQGECVYTSTRARGNVNLQRYGSGTFYLRVQTTKRTVRCRFFLHTF